MSYVMAVPEAMGTAATDLANIGSALSAAQCGRGEPNNGRGGCGRR